MERMFYIAELVGSINLFCTIAAVLFGISTVAGWIGRAIINALDSNTYSNYAEEKRVWKMVSKWATILLTIFTISATIIPSKKTYLLMMGGKVVDMTVENNPQLKEIPGKTIDLLNAWIEEETKSLVEKNEQGNN